MGYYVMSSPRWVTKPCPHECGGEVKYKLNMSTGFSSIDAYIESWEHFTAEQVEERKRREREEEERRWRWEQERRERERIRRLKELEREEQKRLERQQKCDERKDRILKKLRLRK